MNKIFRNSTIMGIVAVVTLAVAIITYRSLQKASAPAATQEA